MGNNLLKGKRGIIFGALNDQSIAWKVAERAHEEGAIFVLTNAPIAMRMGEINNLATKTNSQVIPADATNVEEIDHLVAQSMEILGGKIDFVLHSIGMSPNPTEPFTIGCVWFSQVQLHEILLLHSSSSGIVALQRGVHSSPCDSCPRNQWTNHNHERFSRS